MSRFQLDANAPTKTCPYCAETIHAKAIVCRYCGREFRRENTTQQHLDNAVSWYIERGWTLSARTESSLHFYKPKPWSRILIISGAVSLIFGVLYPPLALLGFVLLILSVIDHVIRPDKKLNITLNELEAGKAPTGDDHFNMFIAILAVVAFVLCAVAYRM